MALEDLRNFVAIGPGLATAGQPTEAQLAEVAAHGFRAVVNLGLCDPRYCLPDEAACCRALGLAYHHLPVLFEAPLVDDARRFVRLLDALDGPAFVHCALNYRVSSFVALWGELRLGWSRGEADAHARRFWEPDPIWWAFLDRARAALSGM